MSEFQRHLEVIYCDDARQEVGHKLSLMGIYSADLFVPEFPVTLPKLCVAIKAVTDIKKPFSSLEIFIYQGEGTSEANIIASRQIEMPLGEAFMQDGSKLMIIQTIFMLSPFQLDEETTLRVRVKTESEELKGLALRIKKAVQA